MKRKMITPGYFKRWLNRHIDDWFGDDEYSCPLHDWLGETIVYERLDELPPWCSRFVGRWDAISDQNGEPKGFRALEILDHVT